MKDTTLKNTGMHYQLIRYSTEGPLAWLSLNRPDKLNAISPAMIAELDHALDLAESDPAVRVIVLSGEGRAFSAGFDLDMGMEEAPKAGSDRPDDIARPAPFSPAPHQAVVNNQPPKPRVDLPEPPPRTAVLRGSSRRGQRRAQGCSRPRGRRSRSTGSATRR